MKLTISRKRWLRGLKMSQNGGSYLLRQTDKKMCCLGFLALACGAKENDIAGRRCPQNVIKRVAQHPTFSKLISSSGNFSEIARFLMDVNDGSADESVIKKLMAKIGVKVRFVR